MQQRAVNEPQLEVLRWISLGCPEGVMTGSSYKTSAIALRSRGLVEASKRGGWHASITDVGRYYLEHGRYPGEPPKPVPQATRPTPRPQKSPLPKADKAAVEEKPLEQPEGPAEPVAPRRIVPVPKSLRRPHPIVVELQDGGKLYGFTKRIQPRVLRIVQALAIAAETEGWTAQSSARTRDRWGQEWDSKDVLVIDTGECKVGIRLIQENDRTSHVPTAYELKQKERYSWTRIPEYDYSPSDRLRLEFGRSAHGRRYRWADRARWTLEDKLGQVIDEIEQRDQEAREKRIRDEAKEAERRRLAEEAIAHAKVRLVEQHRTEVLLDQVDAWRRANLVRDYLDAMEQRVVGIPDSAEQDSARDWLDWCRRRAQELNPLQGSIRFPEDPEPSAEALRPFLPDAMRRGW